MCKAQSRRPHVSVGAAVEAGSRAAPQAPAEEGASGGADMLLSHAAHHGRPVLRDPRPGRVQPDH